MDFMTAATVRNLPHYLAEDRARRAEQQAELELEKQRAYETSMNGIAKAFLKTGDYSAAGLKRFAEANDLTMPEIKGLMNIAATFKQLEKQQKDNPKVWARDKNGVQTRVEDTEGVTNYPEPKQPSYVWARNADGTQVRVPDGEGITSQPAPTEPKYVWARDKDGKQVRVPDQEGIESYPAPGETKEAKVPDYMKYTVSTLGKSLGYSAQSGWPDKESEQKFNMVVQNVDAIMKDKDPKEVNQVLFDTIKQYDTELKTAKLIDAIPKDSVTTTVKDAKVVVDAALESGGRLEEIAGELKRKGWKEKDIKKLLNLGDKDLKDLKKKELPEASKPVVESNNPVNDLPAPDESMDEPEDLTATPIDTWSQVDEPLQIGKKKSKAKAPTAVKDPLGLGI